MFLLSEMVFLEITSLSVIANGIFDFSRLVNVEFAGNEYNPIVLSLFGITIVFVALLMLSLAVKGFTKIINAGKRKKAKEKLVVEKIEKQDEEISEEVNVAIAMALHLHLSETHDEESGILTIETIRRNYSPWSSKIYNMTRRPGRSIV